MGALQHDHVAAKFIYFIVTNVDDFSVALYDSFLNLISFLVIMDRFQTNDNVFIENCLDYVGMVNGYLILIV